MQRSRASSRTEPAERASATRPQGRSRGDHAPAGRDPCVRCAGLARRLDVAAADRQPANVWLLSVHRMYRSAIEVREMTPTSARSSIAIFVLFVIVTSLGCGGRAEHPGWTESGSP